MAAWQADRNAQKSLFEKYRSTMLGVCMRYARDRDEAEDILMEGFVKSVSQYKGSSDLKVRLKVGFEK